MLPRLTSRFPTSEATIRRPMLIDDFVPKYEFRERHSTVVRASSQTTMSAAEEWQPRESMLWRVLLVLRGVGKPRGTFWEWAEGMGFLCLARTDSEVVYGQIGRFWSLRERSAIVSLRTEEEFRTFTDPRFAVAVVAITVEPATADSTLLSTETRVHVLSRSSRRRMGLYWLLIRPFSGLLRHSMLNGMRGRAEAHASAV